MCSPVAPSKATPWQFSPIQLDSPASRCRRSKEMNLSETTFIERRDPAIERERGIKVRIFTVSEELPFAGHPTLGTAFHLRGNSKAAQIVLDLKAGKVPVQFED